jgi:hypothetical protein
MLIFHILFRLLCLVVSGWAVLLQMKLEKTGILSVGFPWHGGPRPCLYFFESAWEHGRAGAWGRLVLLLMLVLVLVLETHHDDTTARRRTLHHEGHEVEAV